MKNLKSAWLMLAPGLTGLMLFYIAPFIGGVWYSLTDGSYHHAFVGIANYRSILHNEMFLLGLKNTLELSLICAPVIWLLSFVTASLLLRLGRAGTVYRNALLMPYLMPSSALLMIWLVFFDYGGYVNRLLSLFGLERITWLSGGALRVPVVVMYVWKNLGFSIVLFTAGLQAIPEPLYEYAALEGVGPVRRAFRITLPLITPTAFMVLLMAWVNALKIFKEVYFIGGAYPDYSVYTLQHYLNNMFSKLNYQYVTSGAYSFAAIVLALFGLMYYAEARMRRGIQ